MANINELIKKRRVYFDGGTGTYLQARGLKPGEKPEMWNIKNPEIIEKLHKEYFEAGCDIIKTNTFGINKDKFENYEEIITAAISCAKKAREGFCEKFIAFDMGPTGRMLKPFGDLDFEDCVSLYAENVKCAVKCGVDLILIETMNDALETKAAVIAAKENSTLPVFVTNVYDESGKLMTGADAVAMTAMLEGLGVDAIGLNCSFGPDKMISVVEKFQKYSSIPVIANPNAGLPKLENGKTVFDLNPDEFAKKMIELCNFGATVLGGCCGTTPEHMSAMIKATKNIEYKLPKEKDYTMVSSYSHAVVIGEKPVLIGERINPTGKKKLKEAIKTGDMDYILSEGIRQTDAGVDILDVNVGVPGIDEAEVMKKTVVSLQAVTDKPLQIDSSDKNALEKAMRAYAGKPLVNSVNGKQESMDDVLPLVKKYGGVLIALTLDENGIPQNSNDRMAIANKIINEASKYGISKKNIVVDPLALTVSSDEKSAIVTLETVELLKENGIKSSLGVSNISFGLPEREIINASFFTSALERGLNCAIMNPFSKAMMNSYYSYNVLHGFDTACADYIEYASALQGEDTPKTVKADETTLKSAIISGLKEVAVNILKTEHENADPMIIINEMIIPALNEIGAAFEQGKAFLPQLLMSAEAASAAFEIVKEKIGKTSADENKKIVLATVKGDIHDIGKNIVKVLMESYGFTVIDLGRDVEPQEILNSALENNCSLIGLSALMTTTVPAMEETIRLVKSADAGITVVVGGAVLTQEYADMINADFYGKDAMDTVKFAKEFYKKV